MVREANGHAVEGTRATFYSHRRVREFQPQTVLRIPRNVPLTSGDHGVLRLRNCFASRSNFSAQDDSCLKPFAADEVDQIADPARISPLVVVPGNDFHQVADYQSRRRIHD